MRFECMAVLGRERFRSISLSFRGHCGIAQSAAVLSGSLLALLGSSALRNAVLQMVSCASSLALWRAVWSQAIPRPQPPSFARMPTRLDAERLARCGLDLRCY
ncbi:unnamed protein product [Prorocentrum cordatum]|uniref:Uncharacterized protein n=1 Tax=Prorocentrum cordatum TaxID=2364126 RepID=A0ABN9RQ25_9DINO|nr:unnamed protein product [Polarella glacialis]